MKFFKRAKIFTLTIFLSGCMTAYGTKDAGPVLLVSAETVATIGDHFAAVGAVYTVQCKPAPSLPALVGFCNAFKEYAPKFQQYFPQAVATLDAARAANDASKVQGAEATIISLSTELTKIGLATYQVFTAPAPK